MHQGTLCNSLTTDWFRITDRPVDRQGKHQSRAETHPLWRAITKGFETIFGPPEGRLPKIKRSKVRPIELAAQGRGCLAACLLQMGEEIGSYADFADKARELMFSLFPTDKEQLKFVADFERRKMEFETS